ncbi:MAG: hypothetical protein AAGA43_12395 [Bacteroidota bacterium]
MISSFFSKTKPINYVVLCSFLVLFFGFYYIYGPFFGSLDQNYFFDSLALLALLLEMLIINEIVRREKVTDFSSFAMLFFVLLLVVFPEGMIDRNLVFCNFFLLLSLWRLVSIKTAKNVKHKIFDASFGIGVASLFINWALIYLVLVFLVINMYDRGTFKNWFVPLIAICTLGILAFTTLQFYGGLPFLEAHYRFQINFLRQDFKTFEIVKSSLYVFASLIIMILAFLKLRQKGGGKLLSLRVLFFAFVLSVIVMSFDLNKMGMALLGFFPVSVFITNYLETFKQNRYKEVAIVILLFLPFFILGVQLSS